MQAVSESEKKKKNSDEHRSRAFIYSVIKGSLRVGQDWCNIVRLGNWITVSLLICVHIIGTLPVT